MASLEKAVIQVLDREGDRIEDRDIPVFFNPTEYSLNKRVNTRAQSTPGRTNPQRQVVSGDGETLSMTLLFDTYDEPRKDDGDPEKEPDVRKKYTNAIDDLLAVEGESPKCRFVWGKGLVFEGTLQSANKTFTVFRPDGVPVRAKVTVTFEGHTIPEGETLSRSKRSGAGTKVWRVKEGDTLWAISKKEYGNPTKWRRIADANGIDNPRTLQIGTELEIPPES